MNHSKIKVSQTITAWVGENDSGFSRNLVLTSDGVDRELDINLSPYWHFEVAEGRLPEWLQPYLE
jgi:hypothetical protein